jgi:probable rRNA maturation factor
MKELQVRNRQRDRSINGPLLRSIAKALLEEMLGYSEYELAINLVSRRIITRINERFLKHLGPTDVISFNFREGYGIAETSCQLSGEIYVCPSEAERQAKEFNLTFEAELVRYVTHGVLHLSGYDDLSPSKRKVMKREEDRLVRALGRRFSFAELAFAPVRVMRTG